MSRFPLRAAIVLASLCLAVAVAYGQKAELFRSREIQGDTSGFSPLQRVKVVFGNSDKGSATQRTTEAVKAVAEAQTDERRAEAETELREAVAEQFDLIVKEREEQIAELQERLEKLNKQLEERRAAKDEIVGLRVKVLINEAKGLGFFPGQTNAYWDANPFSPQLFQVPSNSPIDSQARPAELPRPRSDPASSLTPPGGGGSFAPSGSSR